MWLPVFGVPVPPAEGFFVAAFPGGDVAWAIHRVGVRAEQAGLFRGDLVRPDRLHMTVLWFGFDDVPHHLVVLIERAMRSLIVAPFTVELKELVVTPDGMLLRARDGSAVVSVLRAALRVALRREGWMRGAGVGYEAHVTLGHGDGPPMRRRIHPIRFVVPGITLVRSLHGKTVHLHLRHVPFADPVSRPVLLPDRPPRPAICP